MNKKLIWFLGIIIIIFLLIIFFSLRKDNDEIKQDLVILIAGSETEKKAIAVENDYLMPLELVLKTYNFEYHVDENTMSFFDVVIDLDKELILVDNMPRDYIVKKEDEILVSLHFLTDYIGISYIQTSSNIDLLNDLPFLYPYQEALEIFAEGQEATIIDVLTGISFDVKRIPSGQTTVAVVEPITKEDTAALFEANNFEWTHYRRAVLVKIDDVIMAGGITPFPCSGRQDRPSGEIVDYRSGNKGAGINYNYNFENGMEGVLDIHFLNSIHVGKQRVDEVHQQKVLEAAYYGRKLVE